MKAADAEITEIPVLTKTEEIDSDKNLVQDFFQHEDISGLDLDFRRHRNIQVNSIEEYLQTLDMKSYEDGDLDNNSPQSAKGVFKKNYMMKIVEDDDLMSPTRDSAKSTFKKTQISTVSTKSNFKKQEESGLKLEKTTSVSGEENILHKCLKKGLQIVPAAFKRNDHLYFNAPSCQAKIFTTRQRITRVERNEKTFSFSSSMNELPYDVRLFVPEETKDGASEKSFDFSSSYLKLQYGKCDSYSVRGAKVADPRNQLFGILNAEDELILLEFGPDDELEGQRDFVSIHVCRLASKKDTLSAALLSRVDYSTRQEGYCSMQKFIARLIDSTLILTCPSLRNLGSGDLEVKSLYLDEQSSHLMSLDGEDSHRKHFDNNSRRNSPADLLDDHFFEEDSHHFQALRGERVYHFEGSFSL
jgi:hypothetical protein